MSIEPIRKASTWWVDVAVDDQSWGFINQDGEVSIDEEDKCKCFSNREEAEALAAEMRAKGWETVRVGSDARY